MYPLIASQKPHSDVAVARGFLDSRFRRYLPEDRTKLCSILWAFQAVLCPYVEAYRSQSLAYLVWYLNPLGWIQKCSWTFLHLKELGTELFV